MHRVSGFTSFRLLLALLPALLLVSCKSDPPAAPVTQSDVVTGITRDEQGFIVPNARVEAVSADSRILSTDSTDDAGIFVLTNIRGDANTVLIRVFHQDFKPFSAPLNAVTGNSPSNGAMVSMIHNDSACGSLRLTIRDVATLTPINDAEVRLRRNEVLVTTVRTDATGLIDFNYLIAGTYSIRVSKPGYKVVERTATIQFCDSTSLDIRMEATTTSGDTCCRGVLTIIPRDKNTNAVLIGASVRLTKIGMDTRTLTASDAGATFRELCPGTYGVRIAREGYAVQEFEVAMTCNETKEVTRQLEPNATGGDTCCRGVYEVVPKDSTNTVITGATVKLTRGSSVRTQVTTSTGARFLEMCPGTYSVRVSKGENFRVIEYQVTLGCNETADTTLTMQAIPPDSCCNGRITIMVRDSSNAAALNGATVKLWKAGTLVGTSTTGGDNRPAGIALFINRCSGTFGVSISREGYRAREFQLTLGCDEEYERSISLLANTPDTCNTAVLQVRVKDSTVATGGWLQGVDVTISRGGTTIATGTTNVEGGYTKQNLQAPSTYLVTFSKSGFKTKTIEFRYNECKTISEEIRLAP